MSIKSFRPGSRQERQQLIQRSLTSFSGGLNSDDDTASLPSNMMAEFDNVRGFRAGYEGRHGTRLFFNKPLPTYREGISLHRYDTEATGGRIRVTTGDPATWFTETDALSTVMWGDSLHSFFIEGVDESTGVNTDDGMRYREVICRAGTSIPEDTLTGALRRRLNASYFDTNASRIYLLMGDELFVGVLNQSTYTDFSLDGWYPIFRSGIVTPFNAFSRFHRIGDAIFLNNANGLFRIGQFGVANRLCYWRANGHVPAQEKKIAGVPRTDRWQYGYRYIVTMTRFAGGALAADRTSGFIEQETCPPVITQDDKDYTTVYSLVPPINTRALLGAPLPTAATEKAYWRGWGKMAFGLRFRFDCEDRDITVLVDYTNVGSIEEMLKVTQAGIDQVSSGVRFSMTTDEDGRSRFFMYVTNDDGSVRSYPTGIVAPDDSDIPLDKDNNPIYSSAYYSVFNMGPDTVTMYGNRKIVIGDLLYETRDGHRVPDQYTHYSIYRTKDISAAEDDFGALSAFRNINNPEQFIWVADIPLVRPLSGFICKRDGHSAVGVLTGKVSIGDIGSRLRCQTDTGVIDMTITDIDTEFNYYIVDSGETLGSMYSPYPMVIGSDEVFVATKASGVDVPITTARVFGAEDVGKFVFWDDGSCSLITRVSDGFAYTNDASPRPLSAASINPGSRHFNDTITDEILTARAKSFPLRTRFFDRVPDSTLSVAVNGFLVMACRGFGEFYYASTDRLYDIGYYNAGAQYNDYVKDGITALSEVGGQIIVRTPGATYAVDPSQAVQGGSSKYNESFLILPDPTMVADRIGVLSDSAVSRIDSGAELVVTSEPGVRFFNGVEYGENLALGSVQRSQLERLFPKYILVYNPTTGIMMWSAKEGYIG